MNDAARFLAHLHNAAMAVHPFVEKGFERSIVVPHLSGEGDDWRAQRPDLAGRFHLACGEARLRLANQVSDHPVDQPSDRFMDQARVLYPWISCGDSLKNRTDQRYLGEIGDRKQPGAQTVVDVVVVVGDVVGERGDLRLRTRELVEGEVVAT